MKVKVLKPVLLLHLLDLRPKKESLIVEVEDLRGHSHYYVSEGIMQNLLVRPDEAIDHLLMIEAEPNKDLKPFVLSGLLILYFEGQVLINSLHYGSSLVLGA